MSNLPVLARLNHNFMNIKLIIFLKFKKINHFLIKFKNLKIKKFHFLRHKVIINKFNIFLIN